MRITLSWTAFKAFNPFNGVQVFYTLAPGGGNVQMCSLCSIWIGCIFEFATPLPTEAEFLAKYPGSGKAEAIELK